MKDSKGLFLMLAGVAIFILVVGLITQTDRGQTTIFTPYFKSLRSINPTPGPTGLSNLKELRIGKTVVLVERVDTEALRSQGLSGVNYLPSDQGMLFVFDSKNLSPDKATFWMKGMKLPLDFIWISNNQVSEITANVPAPLPDTPDNKLPVYAPHSSIDYVLEVNSGFASKNNIKVGDNISSL